MAARKNPLADKAYELYKDGMKLVDIADQLGKPEGTIRRWKNTYDWDNERSDCKANESERPKRTRDKKSGKRLTPKQEAFQAEFIGNGGNATLAAKNAGYKPTGQTVMFVGADKPISLKSFNVPFGYVKLLIHEECDEMAGVEQMDNIEDTFLRSDTPALDIKIFNPPKSKNNFMNQYVEECKNKPQTRICHSYYYNVPEKWLGKRFFERAEWFKVHKPLYYRNNYMGEVTGTGGGIFDNVEERTITDAEIENMPFFHHGLDFGFEHPQTFEKAWYDEDTDTLYCVAEVFAKRCKNSTFARKIKKYITEEIICDSARPDAIAELQDWGFNAIGAKKRWGSGKGRDYCWEWLQQTTKIVVDPERCPQLAHELTTLEHEQLADGSFSDAYPKLDEDCVMALIYGLNRVIMESRRNNGLYDDEIDEEGEDEEEYEE